jgi:hypothetical protein
MCGATAHVRFTPNSDREGGFLHKVMSALPPKADMCDAISDDGVVSGRCRGLQISRFVQKFSRSAAEAPCEYSFRFIHNLI